MDYTIANHARLFDELIQILNRHHKEDGVVEALEDLRAAKTNYTQRSLDQMLTCLILAIHDLIAHPPTEELRREMSAVIHDFYRWAMTGGDRLTQLAREYEASGGKPLSREEILREIDERRGVAR